MSTCIVWGFYSTLVSCPTTAELCATLVLVWVHSVVMVSWQSSMVVMSTTVLHTVLPTFLGVETGTLLHFLTGTEAHFGAETATGAE